MMEAFIDKENLISMFNQKSKSETINDGLRMLKTHFSLYFNFSIEFAKSDPIIGLIIRQFTQGVGDQNTFKFLEDMLPERPLKDTLHRDFHKHAILFVNADVRPLNKVGGILACPVGDEERIFKMLFLQNKEYGFDRRLKIGKDFNSWGDIVPFALPFTDIIIIDQFLFSEFHRADYNLYNFLKHIHLGKNLKTNLILFIKKDEIDLNNQLSDFIKIAKKAIKEATDIGPNITVIQVHDIKNVNSLAEHDRTVLMNYIRFYSGDCLSNYFNSDGTKKTKGRELEVSSLAKSEYFELAKELISDMQKAVSWYEKNNPDAIQGDKKSNFLRFAE